MEYGSTPSQTVGPYLSIGLTWPDGPFVVAEDAPGAVWIRGTVRDGAGEPVTDALVETWQADSRGHFAHPEDPGGRSVEFRGFGRCPTDPHGRFEIRTVVPGEIPGQAPHIDVSIFARGLLSRLVTRIYFADRPEANESDPVLRSVPAERRTTLLAEPDADGYRFDVRLQGEGETVFFDV